MPNSLSLARARASPSSPCTPASTVVSLLTREHPRCEEGLESGVRRCVTRDGQTPLQPVPALGLPAPHQPELPRDWPSTAARSRRRPARWPRRLQPGGCPARPPARATARTCSGPSMSGCRDSARPAKYAACRLRSSPSSPLTASRSRAELPHGLEQGIAWIASRTLCMAQQALIDERGHPLQRCPDRQQDWPPPPPPPACTRRQRPRAGGRGFAPAGRADRGSRQWRHGVCCCRAGASRAPPVSTLSRSSRRSRSA